MTQTRSEVADYGRFRAVAVVAILTCLTIVSAVDRNVLAVLVEDVKAGLGITDVQFGWLIGPIFILTYNLCLLPMGFLLDRHNRTRLLIAAVILWSGLTLCSAFVTSFEAIAALRIGVAIGEAMLGPAGVSLLGDIFDKRSRAMPTAVFLTGSAVGYSGSAFFSAAVLQLASWASHSVPGLMGHEPWRLTFIGVAIPGLLMAVLLLILGREPARDATEGRAAGASGGVGLVEHLRTTWSHYVIAGVGAGLLQLIGIAVSIWAPAHLMRSFHLTAVSAGYTIGGLSITASLIGSLSLPFIIRARAARVEPTIAYFEVMAMTALFAAPLIAVGALSSSLAVCVACFFSALILMGFTFQLPAQIAQLHAPSHLRAKLMAAMLFGLFLIAGGIGPVLVPMVAASFGTANGGLGPALSVITLGAGASAFFLFAGRVAFARLRRGALA